MGIDKSRGVLDLANRVDVLNIRAKNHSIFPLLKYSCGLVRCPNERQEIG